MAKYRTGKFWWEYDKPHFITLESMRGVYDPALSSDSRCGSECEVNHCGPCCDIKPWIAFCSLDSWDQESAMTPDGLPDGDMPNPDAIGIPFEDRLVCDINGNPYYLDQEIEDDEILKVMIFERLEEKREKARFFKDLQEREDVKFFEDLEDKDCYSLFDGFKSLALRNVIEEPEELDEVNDILFFIDYNFDDDFNFPFREPKSHSIVSKRSRDSKKDIRMMTKNRSYSSGWRGNDKYKYRRK